MKTRSIPLRLAAGAALAVTLSAPVAAGDGGFVILVNRENAVQSLSRSELKKLVTGGTKQWDSGAVVQLGIIPGDAPETAFLAAALDASPRELIARIQEQVFKGELRRPITLRSSADCAAFVRSAPGGWCVAAESQPVPPEAHAVAVR